MLKQFYKLTSLTKFFRRKTYMENFVRTEESFGHYNVASLTHPKKPQDIKLFNSLYKLFNCLKLINCWIILYNILFCDTFLIEF